MSSTSLVYSGTAVAFSLLHHTTSRFEKRSTILPVEGNMVAAAACGNSVRRQSNDAARTPQKSQPPVLRPAPPSVRPGGSRSVAGAAAAPSHQLLLRPAPVRCRCSGRERSSRRQDPRSKEGDDDEEVPPGPAAAPVQFEREVQPDCQGTPMQRFSNVSPVAAGDGSQPSAAGERSAQGGTMRWPATSKKPRRRRGVAPVSSSCD